MLTKPAQLEWNGQSAFLAVKEPAQICIFLTNMRAKLLNVALAVNAKKTLSNSATSVLFQAIVHVSEEGKAIVKMM